MYENTGEALALNGADPRARALRWYLGHLATSFRDATEAEISARYRSDDPVAPEQRLRFMRSHTANRPGLTFDRAFAVSQHEGVALLHDEKSRPWRLLAILHPPEPERLRWALLSQAPAPGVVIRRATPADGPALAELERRVPVVDGKVRRTYDRGADYFAATAVADHAYTLLAEVSGVLRGMTSQVLHPARAADRLLRVAYLRHLRVDPAAQGSGVFSALNGASAESAIPHCDSPWSLTAESNEAIDRRGMRNLARSPTAQLRIDTRATAKPAPASAARAADAAGLAELLSAASADLELSRFWSAAEIEARIAGVGSRYGWDRVALGDGAVLGVERGGVRVIIDGPGEHSERSEALAFDVAALPGREKELTSLVRGWCARLADEGIDDLLVTVASPRLVAALAELASSETRFNLNHQFRVAADADRRGYFIDGMLF